MSTLSKKNFHVQIHALRSVPVECLNRGRDGLPKTTVFGGYARGRFSSQSKKAAMRRDPAFAEELDGLALMGKHTCALPELVASYLGQITDDAEAIAAIADKLTELGAEGKAKKAEEDGDGDEGEQAEEKPDEGKFRNTKALMKIAAHEPGDIGDYFYSLYEKMGKKKFAEAKIASLTSGFPAGKPRAGDISLFGRMSTSGALVTVEAAASVAHAMTVQAHTPMFDFFAGREELPEGNRPTPMIENVPFGSGTFYEYGSVHLPTLVSNLDGDEKTAWLVAKAFIQAFARTVPSGKKATMPAFTYPDLLMIEVAPAPLMYSNAFESPVRANGSSVLDTAIVRMASYVNQVTNTWNLQAERRWLSTVTLPDGCAAVGSFNEMLGWLDGLWQEAK